MEAAWWQQGGGCGGFARTVRKCTDACAFERHQRADVHVFVLGRGRRDDSANDIAFVGSKGRARGNVYHGRRCAAAANDNTANDDTTDADGNADNIVLQTKLNLIFIYIYHYIDRSNHAFGGPNHDDSVRVDVPTHTPTPQPSFTTC